MCEINFDGASVRLLREEGRKQNNYTESSVLLTGAGGGGGLFGAYFDLWRSAGPYLISTNGIGTSRQAMQPTSVEAHLGFNDSYICVAKSGKLAPNEERITALMASAEAAT